MNTPSARVYKNAVFMCVAVCLFCGWPPAIFVQNAHARVPRLARIHGRRVAADFSTFGRVDSTPSSLPSPLSLPKLNCVSSYRVFKARALTNWKLVKPPEHRPAGEPMYCADAHTHTYTYVFGDSQLLTDLSCQFAAWRERELPHNSAACVAVVSIRLTRIELLTFCGCQNFMLIERSRIFTHTVTHTPMARFIDTPTHCKEPAQGGEVEYIPENKQIAKKKMH